LGVPFLLRLPGIGGIFESTLKFTHIPPALPQTMRVWFFLKNNFHLLYIPIALLRKIRIFEVLARC
jgi:hypothetical protein